ncbi:2-dehydropantoate 2-reductase [Serratia fonticola]|uniref:2-dehydropantoate 2-reductase n=1 Tax=Serratia fonticola TaxID=47917 RepID=A0AAJ1YCR7_SERFO|nr:2-dehydropantoate 2-reductase [Serratia fonticola]MDQ9127693.1 2-dehydropantoate 2-reductase [Serratia fonticola]
MSDSSIVVWGAGAMGGTLAAYWIRAGKNVLLVDNNPAHVAAINQQGLRISGPIEEFVVSAKAVLPEQLFATNAQGEAMPEKYPRIFLCTKAQHTEAACRTLAPHLTPQGEVISVQNGLNELIIADIVGESRCIGCFINFGADILEPGHIHYAGRGAVVVGELNGTLTPRLGDILQLMQVFEPNALQTERIFSYLWGKLGYGALLFGTALTNESIVDVLAHADYRAVLIAIGKEVCAVADAANIPLEGFNGFHPPAFRADAPMVESHASMDAMVAFNQRSAKTHSGIWRDLAIHKRTTEVDQQLGVIVRQAEQLGIATPLLQAVIAGIHLIEQGAPLAWANLDRVAALLTKAHQE